MSPPKGYNFNAVTCELLPKLIKELTGFEDGDENKTRCEQFGWSAIRNHRYLSTNSHDVRRRIKGIHEKFRVDNQEEYANYFERLCQEFVEHPYCTQHYEVDVQWSVLDFLLTLAYNPTGALRRNKYEILITPREAVDEDKSEETELELLKKTLREDFIPLPSQSASDSELSDWSDSEEVPKSVKVPNPDDGDDDIQSQTCKDIVSVSKFFPGIKPPEKAPHYRTVDNTNAKQNLLERVQNSWWLPNASPKQVAVESTKMEANFAILYHKFLNETSNNLLRREPPSTVSEYCLMREVLWMFHSPQKCKFFDIDSMGLKIHENVTIPSLTANGLHSYLEQHFIPYMRMMHTLRTFIDSINNCEDYTPPKTIEIYTANLHLLLQPLRHVILDYEKRLMQPRVAEINTIIQLETVLREPLCMLEAIHNIHQQCVLNMNQNAAHISSAYLLTSLLHCNTIASNSVEANLAMSLFVTSVKTFCTIIDTWWTEGRLEDWQHEFLVQSNPDRSVSLRLYRKDKGKAFFVASQVSKLITESKFFELLLEHSLEAGYTLNLLYEINRISDLKTACSVIEDKLYNVFVDDVLMHLITMQKQINSNSSSETNETIATTECPNADVIDAQESKLTGTDSTDNIFSTNDVFLLSMFNMTIDEHDAAPKNIKPKNRTELNALEIFEQYEKTKGIILPLEEIILNSLSRMLQTRIASANSYVVQLYSNEFAILTHLGNIRKVLLLEASDIMHQFYSKLFKEIESGREWAFPFLLTMQLDDIISTKYTEMASLFRLEINSTFRCKTNKVFEAVDELTITYNFSRELSYVITTDDIEEYNQVFRLLLKVKWGLMTLESLHFPQSHKRRSPFAPFEMIDLLMRRLEQLRFWMMYAIQSIHFYLMAHVLEPMGAKLDENIVKCRNLKEMQEMHKSYIRTISEHCFLQDELGAIKLGVEQLLNLTFILRMEWNSCVHFIECNNPLAPDIEEDAHTTDTDIDNNYIANSQIDAIELTYIRCHQYLANKLNNEVYLRRKTILSGLSDAFNTSLPH